MAPGGFRPWGTRWYHRIVRIPYGWYGTWDTSCCSPQSPAPSPPSPPAPMTTPCTWLGNVLGWTGGPRKPIPTMTHPMKIRHFWSVWAGCQKCRAITLSIWGRLEPGKGRLVTRYEGVSPIHSHLESVGRSCHGCMLKWGACCFVVGCQTGSVEEGFWGEVPHAPRSLWPHFWAWFLKLGVSLPFG